MIRIGVCGFPTAQEVLFQKLDVVEVQKTFYTPLSEKHLLNLRKKAPPHFIFTMKAFQGITHPHHSPTYRRAKLPPHFTPQNLGFFQPTQEVQESTAITLREARALKAEVIVIQCPPSFQPTSQNLTNLRRFFQELERNHFIFGFEPRGNWPSELVRQLCEELDLIHIVDPFYASPLAGKIRYFRLHGRGSYHYRYTPDELKELARKLQENPQETFCLFNNTFMLQKALELKEELIASQNF